MARCEVTLEIQVKALTFYFKGGERDPETIEVKTTRDVDAALTRYANQDLADVKVEWRAE